MYTSTPYMLKILTETKERIEERYKLMMGRKSESQKMELLIKMLTNNYFKTQVLSSSIRDSN
jgi:hypothetical protein